MARIIESYYENPREVLFFFYYPSEEYISYLMTVDELEFYDEIDCGDLFEGYTEVQRNVWYLNSNKYNKEKSDIFLSFT